jgi:hypothetical protein
MNQAVHQLHCGKRPRRHNLLLAVLLIVASIATQAPVPINGQANGPQREADKREHIKRVMAKRNFTAEPVVRTQEKRFCDMFLSDFRVQTNIEFVEPDATADRYDAPVWQPYRSRCTSAIFESYHCEPHVADEIRRMPNDQRPLHYKTMCQHYRGTANFKHYLVDINDNPKDGQEHIFYHEREEGPLNRPGAQRNFANGGYSIVDLDRCELKGGSPTHDPYSYDSYLRPLANFTAIIRYKQRHYVFHLYELEGSVPDVKNPHYGLRLDGYARFGREPIPRLGPLCLYSTTAGTQP